MQASRKIDQSRSIVDGKTDLSLHQLDFVRLLWTATLRNNVRDNVAVCLYVEGTGIGTLRGASRNFMKRTPRGAVGQMGYLTESFGVNAAKI